MTYKFLPFLLLLFPYLLWADSDTFKLNGKAVPAVVAKVNGVDLSATRLESQMIAFRLRAQQQGQKIDPTQERLIAGELLKAEIAQELLIQKAHSLNIKITSDQIDLEIQNIEDKFPSHTAFITALAFQRLNIKNLKRKIERTLIEDELIRQEIAPNVKLQDDTVKNFYHQNKRRFSKPALYRIRHILIATINPSGEAEDESNRKKAQRMANMINEEAKQKANNILIKVKAGEVFEQLAKQYSEDESSNKKGGLLGDLHPGSTIPEISETMVKLKEGETSGIFKSAYGYHILKLDEFIPSELIPFDEAKSDILNLLLKKESKNMLKKYLMDLEKQAKIEIFI